MKYLKLLPKIYYDVADNSNFNYVTNLSSSASIENKFLENTAVYYTYDIRDGDTPDNLAAKFYNSSERYWIILMMNNIVDPQYDWPLQYDQFNEYVDYKYSQSEYADTNEKGEGIRWAKNTVANVDNYHSFYKVITKTVEGVTTVTKLPVDANTYYNNEEYMQNGVNGEILLHSGSFLTYSYSKEIKTYYDYEYELNESKREIKILKQDFVSVLENEIKELYQQ
jgi:hypothetical protein